MEPMISAPTTARCQKSGMPRIGSARLMVTSRTAPERRAPHRAAAAEDGDPADDDGGDGLQLEAGAGAGADRPVAGGVEDARRGPASAPLSTKADSTRRRTCSP
jgi:hypothetical protein